ncbi:MAG: galactose mutarotase [Candidatus Hydrogenedentes bacterium]|nr:galactose mutarotase [Candidatus Hydrogenedentota bacterium]HOJ69989.1 aldose epimerase family protein [Candidatus Hydrogenedentota bacterium]
MSSRPFGVLPDGREATLYLFTNRQGARMGVTNYGAIVTHLWMPDREGKMEDVVLGYDALDRYLANSPYFGAIVGRYGNRIAKGRFTLNGREYQLATNDGPNHLHGGLKGLDKVLWTAEPVRRDDAQGLKLRYLSPDGEEGYPGNLDITVTYWLTDANELEITYAATTDKPTPVNLTHHGYFNLKGHDGGDILDHLLQLNASRFTPVDATLIPTGELRPVAGTPFDFTTPTAIGARVNQDDEQLKFGRGYDHNWVLDKPEPGAFSLAAILREPESGRVMEVWTTEPGIQFYCGNFMDGSNIGKGDVTYHYRNGLCLETQHFPDSPNKKQFPSVILNPGKTYSHRTVYRFRAE